jgi:hypothetical protein
MKGTLLASVLVAAAHGVARAECEPTPYSIAAKEAAGKVTVNLPLMLAGDSTKPTSVDAGGDFVRTMYAAMGPTVVSDLLTNYGCKVKMAVDADNTKTTEQKTAIMEAWYNAADTMTIAASLYFPAFAAGFDKAAPLDPTRTRETLTIEELSPAPYISTLKKDNFLIQSNATAFMQANIKGISATACGKYLRAALAANAAGVQQVAASMLPTINNYFSGAAGRNRAKVNMFAAASSFAMILKEPVSDKDSDAALKQCVASRL